MTEVSIDRSAVRELVEDFWRSYILFIRDRRERHPSEELAEECRQFSSRAWERFEATAALMPSEQGQAFMRMIDEEDTICSQEHHFHPDRFYQRLALSPRARNRKDQESLYRRIGLDSAAVDAFIASPATAPVSAVTSPSTKPTYYRQGIAEMAVRTAVRATIWELIRSLFRR